MFKMDQDTRWLARYNEVITFIETDKCNPSNYNPEERLMCHFIKRNRKLMNAGEIKVERVVLFEKLLALCGEYRRVNQYQ